GRRTIVDRSLVGQRSHRDVGDQLAAESHPPSVAFGHLPYYRGVQVHFSNTLIRSDSRPRSHTISIRSCDSESRISYGVRPGSRSGTWSRSSSIPPPP